MKKFFMGVLATLGAILVGKGIYRKGWEDSNAAMSDNIDLIKSGYEMKDKENKVSKKETK